MKKEVKILAITLVTLFIFLTGFGLGAVGEINVSLSGDVNVAGDSSASTQTEETTVAVAATTTAAASTDSSTDSSTDADATTAAASSSALPTTVDEIAVKYNELVNALKAEQNILIYKTEEVVLDLTDCSVSMATSLINPILSTFITPVDVELPIVDGTDVDGNDAMHYIYPWDRPAEVLGSALSDAYITENADGSYVMYLTFASETSTYDGTTTVEPTGHIGAMDPLNLATLDISPATIDSAEMLYTGATIELSVGADGKVTNLYIFLPMSGGGSGSISVFSLSLEIEGSMETNFAITYN
ncbi:MAG: hypothetical protein R3Y27_06650 [Clostridia bacterium]